MSVVAGSGGRVSRAVVECRRVRLALVNLAEVVAEAVDREHAGCELSGLQLAGLTLVVSDRLEEAVLQVPLPEGAWQR